MGLIDPHDPVLIEVRPDKAVFVRHKLLAIAGWSLFFGASFYLIAWTLFGASMMAAWSFDMAGALASLGMGLALVAAAILTSAFYMWIFGELGGWRKLSGERWVITENQIRLNALNDGETGTLGWVEVDHISRHFPKAIRLRLDTGQAVVIRYLADPKKTHQVLTDQLTLWHQRTKT